MKALVTFCIAINVVCLFKSQGCRVCSVHGFDDDDGCLGFYRCERKSPVPNRNKSIGTGHLVKLDIPSGNFGKRSQAFAIKQVCPGILGIRQRRRLQCHGAECPIRLFHRLRHVIAHSQMNVNAVRLCR